MPWFKVDDNLCSHRKTRKAGVPAMGLWVLAGSWSAAHLTDGFVPDYIAEMLDRDYAKHAESLVGAGLWTPEAREDESGWQFNGWVERQPTREDVEVKRSAARERMQRARSQIVRANSERTSQHVRTTPTRPDPTHTQKKKESSSEVASDPDNNPRPEVAELCQHLADLIARNGNKAPKTVGKRWHQACRLMLDVDGHTPEQVRRAIDWSQADPFWSANILSMPKLREKYDTLRAQAANGRGMGRQVIIPAPSYETPPAPDPDTLPWKAAV